MAQRELKCACCGESAGKWEQWHNQDSGYGICRTCVDWITGRTVFGRPDPVSEPIEFCRTYGLPGVNYQPLYYRHYGLDFAIVAQYPETEIGSASANKFMEWFKNAAVLVVKNGQVILARTDDSGTKPAQE